MKLLIATIIPTVLLLCACSDDDFTVASDQRIAQSVVEILSDKTAPNPYDSHIDTAPDDGCVRLRVAQIGPLRRAFNDSNYIHLEAARELGIEPITCDANIWRMRRPMVRIESCPEYFVDELTHSYPFLVPEAADLLSEIGRNFNDSLAARGGGHYRIKVTSVLRTPVTVKRLRRVNRNAVEESTHTYGTTFDISYSKFICDDTAMPHRSFEDLKNLLGEILYDLRARGKCYVKYEAKQSCFHITTRAPRPARSTGS